MEEKDGRIASVSRPELARRGVEVFLGCCVAEKASQERLAVRRRVATLVKNMVVG